MASQANPQSSANKLTRTTYYFAYGSNLHLKQMKRRCPNSKFIGCARLANYRWQINERGYANIIEAEGHWVDGLVYEIDQKDEARLDVNEGVSKNAYAKFHLPVLLRRAHGALYRRPTSWIVDKGGPAKVIRQAKQTISRLNENPPQWEQNVLVYISFQHIQDSTPKDEYVGRINLGIADAKQLGLENDYISNCIRPFVPAPSKKTQEASAAVAASRASKPAKPNNKPPQNTQNTGRVAPQQAAPGRSPVRRNPAPTHSGTSSQGAPQRRPAEPSPARQTQIQTQARPTQNGSARSRPPSWPAQTLVSVWQYGPEVERILASNTPRQQMLDRRRASSDIGMPPPLPPRPLRRMRSIPVIIIEEEPPVRRYR